jgi:hypothetical protein
MTTSTSRGVPMTNALVRLENERFEGVGWRQSWQSRPGLLRGPLRRGRAFLLREWYTSPYPYVRGSARAVGRCAGCHGPGHRREAIGDRRVPLCGTILHPRRGRTNSRRRCPSRLCMGVRRHGCFPQQPLTLRVGDCNEFFQARVFRYERHSHESRRQDGTAYRSRR